MHFKGVLHGIDFMVGTKYSAVQTLHCNIDFHGMHTLLCYLSLTRHGVTLY